jgi:hypothetical protein
MEIKDIKPGIVFRYTSKYDNKSYTGVVEHLTGSTSPNIGIHFYGKNKVGYRIDEVEWLDEIRDDKLNQLFD